MFTLGNVSATLGFETCYSVLNPANHSSTGAIDDNTELLAAPHIVEWVDVKLAHSVLDDPWEGYKDEAAKDESRAWVALLEGNVHAALVRNDRMHTQNLNSN